jgi:hypothetical protein
MKYYISGKITGNEKDAFAHFERAEKFLQERGHDTVNPMKLPHNHGKVWSDYMLEDIVALMECDGILMLNNWTESKGAKIEFNIAAAIELEFIFES